MKRTCDVLIAGGGVVGSACAYFLASNDSFQGSVVVVEPDPTYQYAASTLSAGSIRQQFSVPINISISNFGLEFLKAAPDLLAVNEACPDMGLVISTYLYLSTQAGLERLTANVGVQQQHGVAARCLNPDQLHTRFPWMNVNDLSAGAITSGQEGWFDGYQLLMALRRKAGELGVDFIDARVDRALVTKGNRVDEVLLDNGSTISCGSMVNATGTYSRQLCADAGIHIPVMARKRCVFVFHCPEATPDCPLVIDPSGLWFRPEGRQYLCGLPPHSDDNVALDDFSVDHHLFDDKAWPLLAHRVPAFESVKVTGFWAGHYDYNTFDQNAIVGPHPEISNFYFCSGFSGHGLQQAPGIGRGISEHIIYGHYRSLDLSPLAFDRLARNEPLIEHNVI